MATRPVFFVTTPAESWVRVEEVSFQWFPGMSLAQKRRSIDAMQAAAHALAPKASLLEISTKSAEADGRALSGFELCLEAHGRRMPVESLFQGSKLCRAGNGVAGPYQELYAEDAVAAKRDSRLAKCHLAGFRFFDEDWPLDAWPPRDGQKDALPPSAFYDYLYFRALGQQPELASKACGYAGFTDLEFTPGKSDNCQAFSAALFTALTAAAKADARIPAPGALAASAASFPEGAKRLGLYAAATALWPK
ncbi:MAG: hypothetical protein HDR50_01120 [Desulfovibrio sp.]|uniref:DarT1-associated NADAR antitoxin family protein n=1 Tax=Desulfovibrio sp. TaxID=885 RepID=UPI001A657FCC|nr:hypothetical protein [Desulfovibrio sp.]MBD5416292.1 hypothetical protein [Desulfovibrio sp.]